MSAKSAARSRHAFYAGVTAMACWAAGEELSSRKPVRVAGLLMVAAAGMAGLTSSAASNKAKAVDQRLSGFLGGGGYIGGTVHVAGDHNVGGDLHMTNGGSVTMNGGPLGMGNGDINNIRSVDGGGNKVSVHDGLSLTAEINMNGHNLNSGGGNMGWMTGSMSHSGDSNATTVAGLRDYVNNSIKQKLVNNGYMQ